MDLYNNGQKITISTSSDAGVGDYSRMFPLSTNTGEEAFVIEKIVGKAISASGALVTDSRATYRKIENGDYSITTFGSSYAISAAAYDDNDNLVRIIAGKGILQYMDVSKVEGASYFLIQEYSNVNGVLTRIKKRTFAIKSAPSDFMFHPLPKNKAGLKILTFGNSFTIDIYEYLGNILQQAGITDATIANTFIGGGTLEDYYTRMVNGTKNIRWAKGFNSIIDTSLSPDNESGYVTFDEMLTEDDWDIVFIQQSRACNYDYNSYAPYLKDIIEHIKLKARKKDVCVGFIQVWATADEDSSFPQTKRWNMIVDATKQLIADTGLDFIVPCGTAIQYARHTDIETARDWTRDSYHSDLGVARYVEAATFFQYVFGQVYDKDIRDYKAFRTTNGTPVTDDNIDVLTECAYKAWARRFFYEDAQ